MDFYNAYCQGFARVAACTHHAAIGDPAANADAVLRLARQCHNEGVALAVFPELTLSGYSIEDILLQDVLLDAVDHPVLLECGHRAMPGVGLGVVHVAPADVVARPVPLPEHRVRGELANRHRIARRRIGPR